MLQQNENGHKNVMYIKKTKKKKCEFKSTKNDSDYNNFIKRLTENKTNHIEKKSHTLIMMSVL